MATNNVINNEIYVHKHTLTQKIVLTIHSLTFFSAILSPFYLSWESQIRYGYLFSYGMTGTILGWILFGRCIVSDLENSGKYGSIATFLMVVVGLNVERYHQQIHKFITYSSLLIKLYYAPSITYMFISGILFLIYKMNKWIRSCDLKKILSE